MGIWDEVARTYQMYKNCFPKGDAGMPPKQYGMAIQGKRKKKKKRGNKNA